MSAFDVDRGEIAETVQPEGIAGERGRANVRRGASVRGRLQTALALLVIASLLGGFLYWWYARLVDERVDGTGARALRVRGGEGEYVLPALGRVDAPWLERLPKLPFTGDGKAGESGSKEPEDVSAEGPANVVGVKGDQRPSDRAVGRPGRAGTRAGQTGADGPLYKSGAGRYEGNPVAGRAVPDRRLAAPVMWRKEAGGVRGGYPRAVGSPGGAGAGLGVMDLDTVTASGRGDEGGDEADDAGSLANALRATGTPPARAAQLPEPAAWLPKGSYLDCTLETAIDSTLPGFATCVTAFDAFGADGSRVLLPRGTRLVGEVRTATRVAQKRVFVLWQEARTPDGVIVPLASPATDALGRSGVTGEVDRHFMARFGAAFLVSLIDAGVQRLANAGRGGSDVIVNPRGSSDVATEILRDTIRIPPTIKVAPGARVQVLVARNVDFRGVAGPRVP